MTIIILIQKFKIHNLYFSLNNPQVLFWGAKGHLHFLITAITLLLIIYLTLVQNSVDMLTEFGE